MGEVVNGARALGRWGSVNHRDLSPESLAQQLVWLGQRWPCGKFRN